MSNVTLKQLLEAGSHFGHQVRRWNPKMKQYIFGERGGVHIFDLGKTKEGLDSASEFVKNVIKNNGNILFVGTKRQAADMIKASALRVGMPYFSVRWVGGFLTNWNQISKRINKLGDMKSKRAQGEYKKYTKYEQLQLDREIQKLEKFLGGVAMLTKTPDALFVVDTHRESVAVAEAKRIGIPVVGIVDTNGDPTDVQYVIPANDDATGSIELLITEIANAVAEAKGLPVVAIETSSDSTAAEVETVEEVKKEVAPKKVRAKKTAE